ncbi:MAG TPA: ferredoxin--nitrite reductase [Persephonella sp.]|uniref:Ferredoxin--nitrite reductase n=1 Tax=Persephonella marina (strain DSM 14350 / EX-H1) TaxID=123214 RepID=C0QPT2_PERMH|nr:MULTISPECIES: ferredoxin--nitrite reductase [Persephonella]ACO03606.1 ferredoxin--nitrite reductase [Persephonella marina EX-H1]HCB69707.1 ferredoxin--nitrite reductase [Persephonella sp.]
MERLIKISEEKNKRLNKIEQLKERYSAEEAFERIKIYAQKGFSSIPEHDLNFFLKNFGIFYRPSTPERFMIRVRVPGGRLKKEQAIEIGRIAREFGRDYIDITTRMQVELRYIRIEDIPVILERLESVGITTYQTGVDNFRNIVQDPLDGLSFDNVITTWDILQKIQSIFLKNPEWLCKLPRKFNISINGSFSNRCNAFGHDLCFVLAEKNGIFGFNVYLGGKVGEVAKPADLFLTGDLVPTFFEGVGKIYRKYGFRDSRNRNRIKYLIDAVGMKEFINAVENEIGIEFQKSGRTLTELDGGDHPEKIQLKDGSFAVHVVVPAGIFSGSDLLEAVRIIEENGNGEIRFTVEQNFYITGIKDPESIKDYPLFKKYRNRSTAYFTNLTACAGTEHCPFGIIPNKPDAIKLADYLSEKYPLDSSEGKIRMYWSACQKGCGIHGMGDLGFVGVKFKKDGKVVTGVDIYYGGTVIGESTEGKLLLRSIPLDQISSYIEQIVKIYIELKKEKESFEKFYKRVLSRISKEALRFIIIFNNLIKNDYPQLSLTVNSSVLNRSSEEEEIFTLGFQLYRRATGKNPYSRNNILEIYDQPEPERPSKLNPYIPKKLESVILRMITKDNKKRYRVFTEIEEDLKEVFYGK